MEVIGFEFPDGFEDHIWEHGLRLRQVMQVADHPITVIKNKKRMAGTHKLFGVDGSSQCISIPASMTSTRGICRVHSAWPCDQDEYGRLMKRYGR
jgi:hypothetical protein